MITIEMHPPDVIEVEPRIIADLKTRLRKKNETKEYSYVPIVISSFTWFKDKNEDKIIKILDKKRKEIA